MPIACWSQFDQQLPIAAIIIALNSNVDKELRQRHWILCAGHGHLRLLRWEPRAGRGLLRSCSGHLGATRVRVIRISKQCQEAKRPRSVKLLDPWTTKGPGAKGWHLRIQCLGLHVFTSFKAFSLRQAKIFMPQTTPNIKVDAVRRCFAAGRSQLDDFQRSRNAVTVPICLYHPISMYAHIWSCMNMYHVLVLVYVSYVSVILTLPFPFAIQRADRSQTSDILRDEQSWAKPNLREVLQREVRSHSRWRQLWCSLCCHTGL